MQKKKIANLPEQINITNIKSSTLMKNGAKRYSMLSYGYDMNISKEKEQIVFQTPLFERAMEIEHYNDYGDYYYVIPNNSEGNKLVEFISELEKHVIKILFNNKENWFPNIDNVTFRSLIKSYTSEEGVECKVIKFKIPYDTKTNLLNVETIDNLDLSTGNREKISVKEIEGGLIRMIVNVNAIWLTDNMFGIYLRPVNIEEIRPPVVCDDEFEFQNTTVNNETISKTVHSISHYIESEIKEHRNIVGEVNNINNTNNVNNTKNRHMGRRLPATVEREKEKNRYDRINKSSKSEELTLRLSDSDDDSDN